MTFDRSVRYPTKWLPPSASFPLGVPKNSTTETSKDGSPFEKDFISDTEGMLQGLITRAGITISGNPDTALVSDVLNALFLLTSRVFNTLDEAITNITMKAGMAVLVKNRQVDIKGGSSFYIFKTAQEAIDDGNTEFGKGNHHSIGVPGLELILVPVNGVPTSIQFGARLTGLLADESNDIAALDSMFTDYNYVTYSPGIYPIYDLAANNIVIDMSGDVIFRVLNNVVSNPDTTGPASLLISGENVTINGDFTCDGNNANNDASAFAIGSREGAFVIGGDGATGNKGNGCQINGSVTCLNPYFNGFFVGRGDDTGDEVENWHIDNVIINGPVGYSASIWTALNWSIGSIKTTVTTPGDDARVRLGNGTSVTGICKNGKIGPITAEGSVVFEADTENVQAGDVTCTAFKTEDNIGNSVNSLQCVGAAGATFSFAVLTAEEFTCGPISVKAHNGSEPAIAIADMKNSHLGAISVIGTVTDQLDMRIRSCENSTIDSIKLLDPDSVNNSGLLIDVGFAPQDSLNIGNIISRGHAVTDIQIENGFTNLVIDSVNQDALFETNSVRALSLPFGTEAIASIDINGGTGVGSIVGDSFNVDTITENQVGIYKITYLGRVYGDKFTVTPKGTAPVSHSTNGGTGSEVLIYCRDAAGAFVRPVGFNFEVRK